MNTLFIGPYRQNDGWGLAAKDYIKSLLTNSNINLTIRPIYLAMMNTEENFEDEVLIKCENNHSTKYDMVIQNVLPEHLFYDHQYGKNVGIFTLEINDLSNTDAVRNINRMDEIWVPSNIEKQSLVKSGVVKPVKVISEALDTQKLVPQNKIIFDHNINNTFKFYAIGESVFRKNLEDLFLAFDLEFNQNDNVSLIVKTNGKKQDLENFASAIQESLCLKKRYRQKLFIVNRLSDQEIIDLHYSCDCFVSCSYGESFCRPAAEALCLGKNPIVNKNTGMKDFVNEKNGFLVNSYKHPVMLKRNPISNNNDYYNAHQHWYKVDIYSLMSKMREAYTMWLKERKIWDEKSELGKSQKNIFSYESIGNNLCTQDIK